MGKINVLKGDITKLKVDAIVNAANNELRGGGGVDGAIHRAGGPAILEACRKIGFCPTGEAVITTGGNLQAKFVIHTVGPIWGNENGMEEKLLENSYKSSFLLAAENGLSSVAFPNISTGLYGFPKEKAAEIAVRTIRELSGKYDIDLIFICFDSENYQLYGNILGTK